MKVNAIRELGETSGDRMLRLLAQAAQLAVIVALTVLATLPLGLPEEARYVLPLLPLAAIHACVLRRPPHDTRVLVPEWLAFACGLALDVLSQGPLGFWAFVYLASYALALAAWPLARRGSPWRLALLVAMLAAAVAIAWVLASLYGGKPASPAPWIAAFGWALPPALVVLVVMRLLDAPGQRRAAFRLEREGWR